jgi:periplasmic mercuric ion binding protein
MNMKPKLSVAAAVGAALMLASAAIAKEATANITVPKMDCDSCAVVIKRALTKTAGVKSTAIDTDKRLVKVVYEDSTVTEAQLHQTIEKTGFEVKVPAKAK